MYRYSIKVLFFPLNLLFQSHDIYFINAFDSFIPVIMLNKLRFKACVLFGAHALLDKSLRVLTLSTHLSNLTVNG